MTTITITKDLDDTWADEESLRNMTDAEILALAQEDPVELLSNACWSVDRSKTGRSWKHV